MISFTKLRIIQHGVIFDYNSHLRETMIERKLISTKDKQGANRPRKDDSMIKLARKLQATAEMMHADLGILGAKLSLMNLTSNKRKTNNR